MTKEGIYEFIARQKTSIISSVGEDGYPATRALIQPVLIDGNDIYFVTYTSSRKVAHYRTNPKVCVYFYEKGRSFSGVEFEVKQTKILKEIESEIGEDEFEHLVAVLQKASNALAVKENCDMEENYAKL